MMENNAKYLEADCINESRLELLSDGKLRTEDGCVFKIHKFVLAKSSKYFTAMFCGMGMAQEDYLIPGIKGDIMNTILSFTYNGSVFVKDENLSELMIAADYLLMDDLLSYLRIILKKNLSTENCISFYVTSLKIDRHDILWECFRFVETHFEGVLHSHNEHFGELSLESLKQFLFDRNLCVESEKTVFLAIVKWVMSDEINRQRFLPDLLECLAIADLNEDLAAMILKDDVVLNNPFCQHIISTKHIYPNADNLGILQSCLRNPSRPTTTNLSHRLPTKLYCVAFYSASNGRHFVQFYVTYDENIDLWRKISEIEFKHKFLTCIDGSIYMFKRDGDRNFRYSITENQWYPLHDFISPRLDYAIIEADGELYVLGGISELTGEEIYDVEVYSPELGVWYSIEPMMPVSIFNVASLNRSIYVVGYILNFEGYEMIGQVYDATSKTWNLLPSLSVERSHFEFVAYHGKVYVIGGICNDEILRDVEMFDPTENEWKTEPHLPYAYYAPKATIINDLLIVYDNHIEDRIYMKTNPPVFWNDQNEIWERFEEFSPMNNLHLYEFWALNDRESIATLTTENRKPDTSFEKSPFA